jgi:hypothetical protein
MNTRYFGRLACFSAAHATPIVTDEAMKKRIQRGQWHTQDGRLIRPGLGAYPQQHISREHRTHHF